MYTCRRRPPPFPPRAGRSVSNSEKFLRAEKFLRVSRFRRAAPPFFADSNALMARPVQLQTISTVLRPSDLESLRTRYGWPGPGSLDWDRRTWERDFDRPFNVSYRTCGFYYVPHEWVVQRFDDENGGEGEDEDEGEVVMRLRLFECDRDLNLLLLQLTENRPPDCDHLGDRGLYDLLLVRKNERPAPGLSSSSS